MPKRLNPVSCDNQKTKTPKRTKPMGELKRGERIVDNTGNKWKLGKVIGIGGFGEIYDVTEQSSNRHLNYVAKIEKHSNGPLFVEINCYLRLGKLEMIEQWQSEHNVKFLGVPHFVASGSHLSGDERYRFLIMPKYDKDLESIFQLKKRLNIKTILVLATRLVDTLEYIHSHGYIHSDIKASNIMLKYKQEFIPTRQPNNSTRRLRTRTIQSYKETRTRKSKNSMNNKMKFNNNSHLKSTSVNLKHEINSNIIDFEGDHVYLIDFGLASKYLRSNGEHREFADERKAHAGTILFCSRDAHKGISSRRSDLESLAYNMIYWLTGSLPWIDDVTDPEIIEKKKNKFFANVDAFLCSCFEKCPIFLNKLFKYLSKLEYNDTPNYDYMRRIFKAAIKKYGYIDDSKLDFDNLTNGTLKPIKIPKNKITSNIHANKKLSFLYSKRVPLSSNFIFKRPNLRKSKYQENASDMHWSKILMDDPETIIKNAHQQRKTPEEDRNYNILNLNIESLNPTPAMRDIFNKALEKQGFLSTSIRDQKIRKLGNIKGYTPEMMRINMKMVKEQKIQLPTSTKKRRKKVISKTTDSREKQKNVLHVGLKKIGSVPLRRSYSLRG